VGLAAPVLTRDAERFAAATEAFLLANPVEHNIVYTVLDGVRQSGGEARFGWVEEDGAIAGAVLRTPPRGMLASTMSEAAARALMPALLEEDPELPGVGGPEPAATYLAQAWRTQTGGTFGRGIGHVVYVLDRVEPPAQPPPGGARLGTPDERDLLVRWTAEFAREAGITGADAAAMVDGGLAAEHLWVWDDGGPVAMTGRFVPVDGVVRISQVYTPPEARRRGLGSALVAAVSERLLAAGARRCTLNADRENLSTNAIYQAIGYRRAGDVQEYTFGG